MFDAILFDLDGTLVDTERLSLQSGAKAFADHGHPSVEDLLHRLVGIDQTSGADLIRAHCPGIDVTSLEAAWQANFQALQTRHLPLKPGAADIVSALRHSHALAVVTSSRRDPAEARLVQAGLRQAFRLVVTRDDVSDPKPHPAPYLLAAQSLGVAPARCLVFEDSEPGAKSAWTAGMTVVQVPDILPSSGQFAHHIAANLTAAARWAGVWT